MASRKALLIAAAAAMGVVIVGALLPPATASAAVYRVGDDSGWAPGVDYNAWASGKTFHVGDILEFVYSYSMERPGDKHDVWSVDEKSYQECTLTLYRNPTKLSTGRGNDDVSLAGAGLLLFISSGWNDCNFGMKLAINVVQ